MSRHRNIRTRNFSEEYDDYDYDQYGRSLEDHFSVSPGTANMYLYDHNFGSGDSKLNQKEGNYLKSDLETKRSEDDYIPNEELTRTKLNSCIHDTNNGSKSEKEIVSALKETSCDVEPAMDPFFNEKKSTGLASLTLEDFGRDNNSTSKLYKAITTKYQFKNSIGYDCYNFRKFIKDFMINSMKKHINNISNSRGNRDSPKQKPLSSQNINNKNNRDMENEKKTKKITPKLLTAVEPEKLSYQVPPSPSNSKITKNIKQKTIHEIMKIYEKKRLNGKLQLNLVIVGHVDAGKSTIMGHLLTLLGNVSKKNMHKNETEAKKAGKASFMYAWVLDETEEERNRGITIDVGQHRFETKNRIVNILDVPGHRDFIPNMITGTTKADVAMLVIDATNGEFESGFESGGQTQEHILLLRSFGITQVTVAINKMDNVNFSQERYNEIMQKIRKFFKQVGFKEQSVEYIPCSGMTGDNLINISKNEQLQWYKGPSLIEIIDNFTTNSRPVDKPFRISISDFFKGQTSGIYLYGKIDYGYVELNQKLLIMPNNEHCAVKNIIIEDENQAEAFSGDVVSLNISNVDGLEISIGNVLCDFLSPCTLATKFEARIVTFGTIETPLINGSSVIIYSICLNEVAYISKLCSQLDKNKNEIIKRNPRLLGRNQAAIVQFKTTRPVCIETFENYKEYGRFVFRSEHFSLGTGIVTKILN